MDILKHDFFLHISSSKCSNGTGFTSIQIVCIDINPDFINSSDQPEGRVVLCNGICITPFRGGIRQRELTQAGGKFLCLLYDLIIPCKSREFSNCNTVSFPTTGLQFQFRKRKRGWSLKLKWQIELNKIRGGVKRASPRDNACQDRSSHGNSWPIQIGTLYVLEQSVQIDHYKRFGQPKGWLKMITNTVNFG